MRRDVMFLDVSACLELSVIKLVFYLLRVKLHVLQCDWWKLGPPVCVYVCMIEASTVLVEARTTHVCAYARSYYYLGGT